MKYVVLPYFWVPEDTMDLPRPRDHVPYDIWEKQGFLETTEEMSSTTDTLKSSSNGSASVSISVRLPLTAGELCRWFRIWGHGFYHRALRTGLQRYVATYQRS